MYLFYQSQAINMDLLTRLTFCMLICAHKSTCILFDYGDVPCGTPVVQPHAKRIVGGYPSTPGSWPWMVMLGFSGYQKCGGSILNNRVVLSSAHCFDGRINSSRWNAHIGKYHVNMVDPTEATHGIEKIIMHPNYNNMTMMSDLALLILREAVVYTDYVRPVCIPPTTARVISVGTTCYATGWGETKGTGDRSVLNQAALPLISDYWCSRHDWYGSHFIRGYTFCAGHTSGGIDTCEGDSGGPYNCKHDGKWYVQGVTSWGYGCAQPYHPGIYTDVSKYISWIRNTAQNAGFPLHD